MPTDHTDYSFMKTGLLSSAQQDLDFMRKITALVKTLMEDAVVSAGLFVKACDRSCIQARDIKMALQYEAHEFLAQGEDLERRFADNYRDEQEHTYETDEDEDDEDDEDHEEENDDEAENDDEDEDSEEQEDEEHQEQEEREEFTTTLASSDPELIDIHKKFMSYSTNWDSWQPEDEAAIFLKRVIDKTPA
jgi:Mg-chelatase subunit ChlI